MNNRDWLNNMAMIDLLDMINSRNGCIILRLGGAADKKRLCSKYISCYGCIAHWLNEGWNYGNGRIRKES